MSQADQKLHLKCMSKKKGGLKSISANFRGTAKYKVVAFPPVKVKEGLIQEFTLEIPSDHPEDRYILVAIKLRDKHNSSKCYSCDRSGGNSKIIGTIFCVRLLCRKRAGSIHVKVGFIYSLSTRICSLSQSTVK